MAREITCYVYDSDSLDHVLIYTVKIKTKAGYTKPTVGEIDEIQIQLEQKLHKTVTALERLAQSSPFDLDIVVVEEPITMDRTELPAAMQEQADQYDADIVRRRQSRGK